MKHSLFDKIFLGFLFLSIAVLGLVLFYSTTATRNALISEKTEVLNNEAKLIATQTLTGYVQGIYSIEDTQRNFENYSSTLDASIWLIDEKGIVQ